MLVIQNAAVGLTRVTILVNGQPKMNVALTPGEQYNQVLTGGNPSNTVVVQGYGPTGASAVAVVWGIGPP
ncbi:MAG: hypothetical protein ACR2MN_09635 [Acidimicrobiales bacterium]